MPSSILLQSGAVGAVAVLIGILVFVATVAMIGWTYFDAQKHSSHPAFLWAIVVFLVPLLGLVLYFLLGRDAV